MFSCECVCCHHGTVHVVVVLLCGLDVMEVTFYLHWFYSDIIHCITIHSLCDSVLVGCLYLFLKLNAQMFLFSG